jgi:hypothetical protein
MNTNKKNNEFEKFIANTTISIRKSKEYYNTMKNLVDKTPIQIKIANILLPVILTYFFTYIYYNLTLSIFFAIVTFIIGNLLSKIMSLIFIILYVVLIVNQYNIRKTTVGEPILETDVVYNKKPYDCSIVGLTISSQKLPKDLNGGYFTYCFWLYLNGDDNRVKNNNTWTNYRYKEWKSIFYRGNAIDNSGDLSTLIQYPGFWLTPVINNLVIVFQNNNYVERIELLNIPLDSWTQIGVVVQAKSVSVYLNGLLDRTLNLYQNITIMNGYNLYIANDKLASTKKNQSGFPGFLAELIYYNYALTAYNINKTYNYYKNILKNYQSNLTPTKNYSISQLITNSDYLENKNINKNINN